MDTQERAYVLGHLRTSEDRMRAATAGLTAEQWHFRESPERWSIAENLEHCLLVENAIFGGIDRALGKPAQPEKKAAAPAREEMVKQVDQPRGREIPAPDDLLPSGQQTDTQAMLADLGRLRARTVAFAEETQAELRDHFFPHHMLGDLDCYQWLVIMSQHAARHVEQIEQLKADPAYPRG